MSLTNKTVYMSHEQPIKMVSADFLAFKITDREWYSNQTLNILVLSLMLNYQLMHQRKEISNKCFHLGSRSGLTKVL